MKLYSTFDTNVGAYLIDVRYNLRLIITPMMLQLATIRKCWKIAMYCILVKVIIIIPIF